MLRSLRIQNFKLWKDTGDIRMTPLTLFFGANSSGKSSIGQFLMMLKQTVESPDRKAVFYPGGPNSAVQLGSFQEMVHHHDPDKKITFNYQWDPIKQIEVKDSYSGKKYSGDKLSFEAVVGLDDKQKNSIVVESLRYQLLADTSLELSVGLKRATGQYKAEAEKYVFYRKQGRKWPLKDVVRFYGFPDEAVAYYQNADFVGELNLHHEKLFQSIYYLGPLRTRAERLYSWSGIQPESVGYAGEHPVAAILSARDRSLSWVKMGMKNACPLMAFEKVIALKIKEMGLIEEFKVGPISDQRQVYEVKVRTKGSDDWVDLPDVGFGISQVLPVLVQSFYAPHGAIILMEQPEIHLHPNAQSALADVMIDVINSRENWEDRNIQLIIETHSEHFLRRLQRRIAEHPNLQEKVSAYFADIGKDSPALEPLKIDSYGNILNWPDNFFGDEIGDITAQAEAAMNQRLRQGNTLPEGVQ